MRQPSGGGPTCRRNTFSCVLCKSGLGLVQHGLADPPENFTTSTATVFRDFGCNGDILTVMNPGAKRGPLLRFRSVVFS